jgi:hypothetical protein
MVSWGGGTTIDVTTFKSKSGFPFEKLLLTTWQHEQCKKEIVEQKGNHRLLELWKDMPMDQRMPRGEEDSLEGRRD